MLFPIFPFIVVAIVTNQLSAFTSIAGIAARRLIGMIKINLKTCPFCGGDAALQSAINIAFWVKCEECGASTQAECSAAAAIQRWNHRYTLTEYVLIIKK